MKPRHLLRQRGSFEVPNSRPKLLRNSAGYLPLTQTINAMVMEDLFFLVHVYHVLTNYTLQCSYESPYI